VIDRRRRGTRHATTTTRDDDDDDDDDDDARRRTDEWDGVRRRGVFATRARTRPALVASASGAQTQTKKRTSRRSARVACGVCVRGVYCMYKASV
jgi:hypothetical protein